MIIMYTTGLNTLNKKLNAGAVSDLTNMEISIYPTEYECLPIQLVMKNNPIPNDNWIKKIIRSFICQIVCLVLS